MFLCFFYPFSCLYDLSLWQIMITECSFTIVQCIPITKRWSAGMNLVWLQSGKTESGKMLKRIIQREDSSSMYFNNGQPINSMYMSSSSRIIKFMIISLSSVFSITCDTWFFAFRLLNRRRFISALCAGRFCFASCGLCGYIHHIILLTYIYYIYCLVRWGS